MHFQYIPEVIIVRDEVDMLTMKRGPFC